MKPSNIPNTNIGKILSFIGDVPGSTPGSNGNSSAKINVLLNNKNANNIDLKVVLILLIFNYFRDEH